jgi:hypothetical protein
LLPFNLMSMLIPMSELKSIWLASSISDFMAVCTAC